MSLLSVQVQIVTPFCWYPQLNLYLNSNCKTLLLNKYQVLKIRYFVQQIKNNNDNFGWGVVLSYKKQEDKKNPAEAPTITVDVVLRVSEATAASKVEKDTPLCMFPVCFKYSVYKAFWKYIIGDSVICLFIVLRWCLRSSLQSLEEKVNLWSWQWHWSASRMCLLWDSSCRLTSSLWTSGLWSSKWYRFRRALLSHFIL